MTYRVRTNIQGLQNIRSRIEKVFNEVLKDKANADEIGNAISEEHKRMIRTGKSPADGNSFKKLAKSTVKRRDWLAKYNATHEKYSKGKSNLTFTGQLVEAITFKFDGRNKYDIYVDGTRREPYRGKSGSYSSNIPNNQEVAKHQRQQGRPMLGITEKMRGIVNRLMIRNLRRLLRKR